MKSISVPQMAWHETNELTLPLPDSWQVDVHNIAGHDRPAMTAEEIKAAIGSPIGTAPIGELAKGKQNVVILFDDMSRVTRAAAIVPAILQELAEAGVRDDQIRFICALGTHGALTRMDFAKKLGEDTMARFPVYNHHCFGNHRYVGKTATYGTEVHVNEEVMMCDLKIAISSVVPHPMSGFGGGGKIILPGVASFETVKQNHDAHAQTVRDNAAKPITGVGIYDDNPMARDVQEAALLAGLDVSINCIVNLWGETVALYAGALKPAFAAAVAVAKTHYLTPRGEGKDIVISNSYVKGNEAFMGSAIARPALRPEGGDIVIIANNPEGQVTHYLFGPFGSFNWGSRPREVIDWTKMPPPPANQPVIRTIVYTKYPDLSTKPMFGNVTHYVETWEEVLQVLKERHGAEAKVAVYPNSEIQYSI